MKYKTIIPYGLQGLLLYMEGIDSNQQQFLREALMLKDLDQAAISNLTARHLNTRMTDPAARHDVKVIEAKWKIAEDEVIFYFYVTPTYDNHTMMTPTAKEFHGQFYNVVFNSSM